MKKILFFITVALVACGSDKTNPAKPESNTTSAPERIASFEMKSPISISQVTVYVRNHDEAIAFYKKMGLSVLRDDATTMEGFRFVEVGYEKAGGARFVLVKAETEEDLKKVGKAGPTVIEVNDFDEKYKLLKESGIQFIGEPEDLPWGKSAVFSDLYGNPYNLLQPKS